MLSGGQGETTASTALLCIAEAGGSQGHSVAIPDDTENNGEKTVSVTQDVQLYLGFEIVGRKFANNLHADQVWKAKTIINIDSHQTLGLSSRVWFGCLHCVFGYLLYHLIFLVESLQGQHPNGSQTEKKAEGGGGGTGACRGSGRPGLHVAVWAGPFSSSIHRSCVHVEQVARPRPANHIDILHKGSWLHHQLGAEAPLHQEVMATVNTRTHAQIQNSFTNDLLQFYSFDRHPPGL